MGIHNESSYTPKHSLLEAEMRRRLWWAIVLLDARLCEQSNWQASNLIPAWDCKTPLNINDSDLRPDSTSRPISSDRPTEAFFISVRSELGDALRHSDFYLDFTNPAMRLIAKESPKRVTLASLELTINGKYLRFCNPENPLQFLTTWMTRYHIANYRLLEHYWLTSTSSARQTERNRENACVFALKMLDCCSKVMASPLTKGYSWYTQMYFPFVAYIFIVRELKRRPTMDLAPKAWEIMSNEFEARSNLGGHRVDNPLSRMFSGFVLQAWEARESAFQQLHASPGETPRIVSTLLSRAATMPTVSKTVESNDPPMNGPSPEFETPVSMDMGFGNPFTTGDFLSMASGSVDSASLPSENTLDSNSLGLDWNTMDWGSVQPLDW